MCSCLCIMVNEIKSMIQTLLRNFVSTIRSASWLNVGHYINVDLTVKIIFLKIFLIYRVKEIYYFTQYTSHTFDVYKTVK